MKLEDWSPEAIAIDFVNKEDWPERRAKLSEPTARFADLAGFEAKAGSAFFAPDVDGAPRVFFGAEGKAPKARDRFFAGKLANALPKGLYRLGDGVDAPDEAALAFLLSSYAFSRYKPRKSEAPRLCAPQGVDRARVERIASHRAWTPEASAHVSPEVGEGLLCEETPCVVTLPYGDHEIVFKGTRDSERVGSATLKVRSDTIVINHTLGREHHPGGQAVGWGITLVGAACLVVALGMAETSEKNHTELSSSVAPLAMAGLGTMLFGGVIGLASPTTRQEGASTTWVPKQAVGVAAGFRF
mgnify:CR=1 FL=1